jgi:hypothetical protein
VRCHCSLNTVALQIYQVVTMIQVTIITAIFFLHSCYNTSTLS